MNRSAILKSKKWTDQQWVQYAAERFNTMESARAKYEGEWKTCDDQWNAMEGYDDEGNVLLNVKLEKVLEDIFRGRLAGNMPYDIVSDGGETDINELMPSKYALAFYLDGNGRESRWRERKQFVNLTSHYGTGILNTNFRTYVEKKYKLKEDAEVETADDLMNEDNYYSYDEITNFFFPASVHIRRFYLDDSALGNPDLQKAEDCAMQEKVSKLELHTRWGNNKNFKNIDKIVPSMDDNPTSEHDVSIDQEEIIVTYYWNRITKDYVVFAKDQNMLLFKGKYLYEDGKLPFVSCQHYSNPNCFYGDGIPKRVRYLKAFKSEILQSILYGAQLNSGLTLIVGNDGELNQDFTFGGRKVNTWRTAGNVQQVQQMSPQFNLGVFQNILQVIDDLIIQESGENPRATYEVASDKVGIVEMMEQNKAIRQTSVDSNYNTAFDDALTMMLQRIRQFARSVEAEIIKNEDGTTNQIIYPRITVKDHIVEKDSDGKLHFVEKFGKNGYFELGETTIKGMGVKVTTPSTSLSLPIFEREKINGYLDNFVKILNAASMTQDPNIIAEVAKMFKPDQIKRAMDLAYGYDSNSLVADTKRSELERQAREKLDEVEQKIMALTGGAEANPGMPGQPPLPDNMPTDGAPQNPMDQNMQPSPEPSLQLQA